jgi:CheY-like chemotaxis protein
MSRGVLIVDDDRFIRKLITTTLEDVTDFELHEASDGREAIDVARRERPAIVFLDVDMPELDGIEACRQLRADETTGNATIVMLTAAQSDTVQGQAEEAGADLFLTKPFSPLDLLRLVDGLSDQSP